MTHKAVEEKLVASPQSLSNEEIVALSSKAVMLLSTEDSYFEGRLILERMMEMKLPVPAQVIDELATIACSASFAAISSLTLLLYCKVPVPEEIFESVWNFYKYQGLKKTGYVEQNIPLLNSFVKHPSATPRMFSEAVRLAPDFSPGYCESVFLTLSETPRALLQEDVRSRLLASDYPEVRDSVVKTLHKAGHRG